MIEATIKVYSKDNKCLLRTETKFFENKTILEQIENIQKAKEGTDENVCILHNTGICAIILTESEDFIQYTNLSKLDYLED